MTIESPFSKPTLCDALTRAEHDVAAFFASLKGDEWDLRVAEAWTAAEHLDHLNIAVSAVARGFAMNPIILRLRFGRARRPSRRYEQLRDDYRARLAAGGRASGQFIPTSPKHTPEEGSLHNEQLLARWHRVNERLRNGLEGWTEERLDRIQLPHPILGKLTAREMIFFTIYHAGHHINAAKSRLPSRTDSTA